VVVGRGIALTSASVPRVRAGDGLGVLWYRVALHAVNVNRRGPHREGRQRRLAESAGRYDDLEETVGLLHVDVGPAHSTSLTAWRQLANGGEARTGGDGGGRATSRAHGGRVGRSEEKRETGTPSIGLDRGYTRR